MPENKLSREITTGGANYVGWRGELLAKLALARVPELSVHKPRDDSGYDFLVAAPSGICLFVLVRAFSSKKLNIRDIDKITELRCRINTDQILHAKESHTPVFVFLIDADTDHGRYLRLDTVDVRNESTQAQMIRFPVDQCLDKDGIENLVAALQKCENATT